MKEMAQGEDEEMRLWSACSKDAYRMRRLPEIGGCQDTVFANEFPSLPTVVVVVSVAATDVAVAVDDFA